MASSTLADVIDPSGGCGANGDAVLLRIPTSVSFAHRRG